MPKPGDKAKVKVNVKERVVDESCDLSLSELSEIPVREIASFKRVTVLDLSSNRLVNLGKNFSILTRLVRLDLSKNQITFLPEDFGQLEQLRHLDLYNNCLEHLPISFGQLRRLRYLDLKGNPLTPAWQKIVGCCSTQKDCQQAAKNTVSICANYKPEFIERECLAAQETLKMAGAGDSNSANSAQANGGATGGKKSTKPNNKKAKAKKLAGGGDSELTIKPVNAGGPSGSGGTGSGSKSSLKNNQKKKNSNGGTWLNLLSRAALSSLVTFLVLFVINLLIIYMIMFKNPDIADKLVEYIPHQYRDWILTKTEIFRLRVTDWISEFRTPPEEH
ncbi:leucine-rich repeat-containing protein 59 [Drosophila subpulchrella]|uniref:leucine-rich repeat-containing protein 59 n=1 Tax=Drosophila subpulchrella TaxID=1486046 RepID=UPI0018A13561|nr:leucine-rich repeat-containing protein 59 [Drosophila subpulchrella]